jgi:X-Pro dipeptidyl-peptidase
MQRVRLVSAALAALTWSAWLAVPASAAAAASEPIYDYATAVRERVWVQTTVDSDGDGKLDRLAVRIIRPRESGASLRVPVILQASPYYGGINWVPNHTDVDRADAAGPAPDPAPAAAAAASKAKTTAMVDATTAGATTGGTSSSGGAMAGTNLDKPDSVTFSGYLDNYFVPRGYAVVFADSLGSGDSGGCPTSGGRNEVLGMKAVIDWLNGRAPAFDESGALAPATWSSGHTGMIGMSYNGTLPNAVAATGVLGLDTIVPIAAVSNWYDYYRADGGVVAPAGFQGEDTDIMAKAVLTRAHPEVCATVMTALEQAQDRQTGDYNAYWAERNYLRDADKVRASVFLVHGLHDDNVRAQQTGQWWAALTARNVPRKLWLHQGEHVDPYTVRDDVWLTTLHRWFDYWLRQVDNGIMQEPMVDVETAPNEWQTSDSWPVPGAREVTLHLGRETLTTESPGRLRRQTFVDDPTRTADDLAANPGDDDPNRLVYLSPTLARDTRLSGSGTVTVRADLTGASPFLSALLVDYGTSERYAGQRSVTPLTCVGESIPDDSACAYPKVYRTAATRYEIVSRGWLDVRNRYSVVQSAPIERGRAYTLEWKLQSDDHVFAAGHRIGLVLLSTDRDHTLRYAPGTEVGVHPTESAMVLPLVTNGPLWRRR